MPKKRYLLGVATLVAAHILMGNIAGLFLVESTAGMVLQSIVTALLASFAGGFVSRKGMVLPAIFIWLVLWAVTICLLYQIAAPVVPNPLPSIARFNWAAVLGSGVATVVGAMCGQALAMRRATRLAAT